MPVQIESTPNPNALKFTVGVDVGGPKTFVAGRDDGDPLAAVLLSIPGITSIFMTADFVTLSKTPDADWAEIAGRAQGILQSHFES
ncbi:MAG: NifU N-terminal domain-containing protein [Acidimicrobiia bacterium]|nr:NifU N-terminal domain-containing protein [Acidimicrobiia bacterium]MDH3397179.1 NifU N-terminal domain-containing protein [Acidimicrobiia bacterium]MDH5616818.1 NifU N-terminal domain-containing protein [Acidimicrobiia bacterium]